MLLIANLASDLGSAQDFVTDLALVLCVAAVTTVLCQWLHQPTVLGYLLAGVIVGPHVTPQLLSGKEVLEALSTLGVILIVFSLGLEFSLRRLAELGLRPAFIVLLEMGLMLWLGFSAARMLGWSPREAVFAGAIVCVSSTAIIRTVFAERSVESGVQEVVYGALVYEDLVAFVLLATLTALSVGGELDAATVGSAALRLALFLAATIVVGLLVVPRAIRLVLRLRRRETVVVACIGLCFALSLLAERAGYSLALGAFLAGSLVSESDHGEVVERLVQPLRDVFAAVFFVSVGTLIDPGVLGGHAWAVAVFCAIVLLGKFVGVGLATFLTGRDTRTSIRSGLSMAQIGEFSFLFAGLGVASGATREFLYPLAVAVASVTAFLSPLLIRASDPVSSWVDRVLPERLQTFATLYASWLETLRARPAADARRPGIRRVVRVIVLDAVLCLAILVSAGLFHRRLAGLLSEVLSLGEPVARALVIVAVAAVVILPVLGLVRAARRLGWLLSEIVLPEAAPGSADLAAAPRRLLLVTLQLAVLLAVGLVLIALTEPFLPGVHAVGAGLLLLLVPLAWSFWRRAEDLQGHVRAGAQVIGEALARMRTADRPVAMADLQALLPGLGDISSIALPVGCRAVGHSLADLDVRGRTGATVVAITRAEGRVVMPEGEERLRGDDLLALTGSHEACEAARALLLAPPGAEEVDSQRSTRQSSPK